MSGHCIDSEDFVIVVDKWDASFLRRPGCKPHYFFLTHLHADHIKGLTSTWSRMIYTSPFNAWLLPMRRNVKPMLLKEIELNVTHTILKSNNEIAFQVTLLDANHCPGAVMFLFQGKFGNILYTGDFRYSPHMLNYPVLNPIIRNKELSVLYLDNTYAAPSCKFPSRDVALKEVLRIVDENPDCKILIGMRQLGKEEVLRAVALHINEKVCVSVQRLQILSKLEYEDVFTTDPSESRIHAVELHTITQRHNQEGSKVVSIKLTSMYECGNIEKQKGNIHVVPYSDHSSHTELMEFVDQLRPLKLYPIVLPQVPKMAGDSGPWYRMSTVNCVIPEEILQLCGPSSDGGSAPSDFNQMSCGSLLSIKFHPAPKIVNAEKNICGHTYFDEGMNIMPSYSLGSHLTNNNKARKHIKASWTRLAPKILSQKGIKFTDSPEKSSDSSQNSPAQLVCENKCTTEVESLNSTADSKCSMSPVKKDYEAGSEDRFTEVPMSDGEEELYLLTSAKDLRRQLQLPSTNRSLNGVGNEDRKSECSSELTVVSSKTDLNEECKVRRTRSWEKLQTLARSNSERVSNDSSSDISSTVRTTRSKASVVSVPIVSRPTTRLSLDLQRDGLATKNVPVTRRSLKGSPNAKGASKDPLRTTRSDKNGLSKKSTSMESLPAKNIKVTPVKKAAHGNIKIPADSPGTKPSPGKIARPPNSDTKVLSKESDNLKNISLPIESQASLDVEETSTNSKIKVETSDGDSSVNRADVDVESNSVVVQPKALPNGTLQVTSFNGFHINSPGRKRLPINCDWNAAQEIVKKETEQALKALETLNQMKGFKTRNLGNRSGLVALRRLSADNVPTKSSVKSQSLVNTPGSPTGLRARTASILSSMASTFSKSSPLNATPSSSNSSLSVIPASESPKELSSILLNKETKKTSPKRSKPATVKGSDDKKKMHTLKEQTISEPVKEILKEVVKPAGEAKKITVVNDTTPAVSSKSDNQTKQPDLETEVGIKELKVPVMLDKKSSNTPELSKIAESSASTFCTDESQKSVDILNQGLFLTDETLASSSSPKKFVAKAAKRSFYKRQNDVNVELMKLKMGFAMTQKGPKRLSLPSRLSFKREAANRHETPPFQSKEKVQDWKTKISLRLRKSPQRRYRFKSPNKLRENAKRTLASILRSNRSLNTSQNYHADVEDCNEQSQKSFGENHQNEEHSGYVADIEADTPSEKESQSQSIEKSSGQQFGAFSQSVLSDSCVSEDSKVGIQNDIRRSSRLLKDDAVDSSFHRPLQRSSKSLGKKVSPQVMGISPIEKLSESSGSNSVNQLSKVLKSDTANSSVSSKITTDISSPPLETCADLSGVQSAEQPMTNRFSDRLLQRTRNILRKSSDSVLAPKSPNLLSLMADAFKKTVPVQTPTTANILSSMAENFKKLDEGAQVSPSLSIQLVPAKPQRSLLKDDSSDWGVQITRIENAQGKSHCAIENSNVGNLSPINALPKSLSIEIIPEGIPPEPSQRKGPSPPTVTISPEVIDLCSDSPEEVATQSSIHSLPKSPGPRRLLQGGTHWPSVMKPEILSPPPAVWKEKRGNTQSGDKVIIDIQTQEDPTNIPHCPVHCTCGAASRQGTCMGTMRNLIEEDADCLYEVPLSPEDFVDSGAMLALGKGWIESCFEGQDDRDEFFESYEDILPTMTSSSKHRPSKPVLAQSKKVGQVQHPQHSHVRQVFSNAKPAVSKLKQTCPAAPQKSNVIKENKRVAAAMQSVSQASKQSVPQAAKQSAPQAAKQSAMQAAKQPLKQNENPKKRLSTPGKGSASLLKEIEKKIKAYNDGQSKLPSAGRSQPPRRSSSQSSSSVNSVPNSRSSKRSLSPIPPLAPLPIKRRSLDAVVKKETKKEESKGSKKEDKSKKVTKGSVNANSQKRKGNSSASHSASPEPKKVRLNELSRLTDFGSGSANKRYRLSVRRSLDHLMTRQKLRSDRRVKTSSSSRS